MVSTEDLNNKYKKLGKTSESRFRDFSFNF